MDNAEIEARVREFKEEAKTSEVGKVVYDRPPEQKQSGPEKEPGDEGPFYPEALSSTKYDADRNNLLRKQNKLLARVAEALEELVKKAVL